MLASRTGTRSIRLLRAKQPLNFQRRCPRFQSTQASPQSTSSSPALVGGLAGGAAAFVGCYTWYYFSGAKTVVNTAHETKDYIQAAQKRFTENAPKPNEALKWLRQVSTYYAGFVPGASGAVESALDDLDTIHEKNKDEVEQIIQDAYGDLKKASSKGLSVAAAVQAWEGLQKHIGRIGKLAGEAAEDVLDNHPDLKKEFGSKLDQLKKLGDQYGPEAKKQVEETTDQVKDILKNGLNSDSANKIRKLVQEKLDVLQKLGEKKWKEGQESIKPLLSKNPKIKELVEENTSNLKNGNFQQLFEKVKKAAESGNTDDLEKFVKDAASQAGKSGGVGLENILKNIPGGDQVLPRLQSLQEIAESHGEEAKKLLNDTIQEVTQVLSKRGDQAKELASKSEKKLSK